MIEDDDVEETYVEDEREWNGENYFSLKLPKGEVGTPPVFSNGQTLRPDWHVKADLADFRHWARYARWNWDETTALYIGISPFSFDWSVVSKNIANDELVQRCHALRRATAVDLGLDSNLIPPSEILRWAAEHDCRFPQELVAAVGYANRTTEPISNGIDEWLSTKLSFKKNIFRLLLAMIIDKYGSDPTAKALLGMKSLESSIAKIPFGKEGIGGPSDDTIKKIVREAVTLTGLTADDVQTAFQKHGAGKARKTRLEE